MLLQEIHSSILAEKDWTKHFSGRTYFKHGKANSCGVWNFFIRKIKFSFSEKLLDSEGRILVLDVTLDDSYYILINVYNVVTEEEQVSILGNLLVFLDKSDLNLKSEGSTTFRELETLKRKGTPSDKIIALGLFSKVFSVSITTFLTIFKD